VLLDGDRIDLADVLVGADGLHSVIRQELFGHRAPRYAGTTSWRGVAQFEHPILVDNCEWWGRGSLFGLQPMSSGRVYWYATKREPTNPPPVSPKERKRKILLRFRSGRSRSRR
jgi:2-polyprenyl-6-methoxyphenol hydroxylase-like FAD-dependent oxidoreductase